MIRLGRAPLLLFLAGSMAVWAQDSSSRKPLKFPLTKTSVKKGALRPGVGIQGDLPESAYQAKVAGESILFLDLNNDEQLAPETDVMAMSHGPFAVTIPETLLLKIGQFKVSFEGTKQLLLTPEDLGAAQALVADASLMTEIRVRSGVRPAMLDAKASADCMKHIEYLKKNSLQEGYAGLALHHEDPSKPGYTPEGAQAGQRGDIFPMVPTMRVAIQGWYQSIWHAVPMVDPGLKAFGAAIKYNLALLYFSSLDYGGGANLPYPPDGAIGLPRSMCEVGENPNPVPGTEGGKGCGLPVFVRGGPNVDVVFMTDPAGRPVAGTTSSPAKPANKEWPTNSGVSCFIPSKPLAPMTTYKVTFRYSDGIAPISWSFTTGR
jgi:hypothetical protein